MEPLPGYAGTFTHLESWLQELQKSADPDILVVVVGNKSDLTHLRSVSTADAKCFCKANNLSFIETSALTAENVELAFEILLTQIYERNLKHMKQLRHDNPMIRLAGVPQKGSAIVSESEGQYGRSASCTPSKKSSCCA